MPSAELVHQLGLEILQSTWDQGRSLVRATPSTKVIGRMDKASGTARRVLVNYLVKSIDVARTDAGIFSYETKRCRL
jgi:hypothetical protein